MALEDPRRPPHDPNRPAGDPNLALAAASRPNSSTLPAASSPEAKQTFDDGLALLAKGELVSARTAIGKAFFSGQLAAADEAKAMQSLAQLADKTVLSKEYIDGDHYNEPYTVKDKDTLEGRSGIEMTHKLHGPAQLLLKVNGLSRGADVRPGKTLKLIKGPFHAVVYKGRFLMDLYLQRDDLEKVFVRRIPVGLGVNGSTPVGAWRIKQGKSREPPTYTATESSGLPVGTLVRPDQPNYPFGKKALWIRLEGTEPATAGRTDIGIHSTNDPASIGKANSLGCIRLRDEDIELVFSLLYDVHSRVDVVP